MVSITLCEVCLFSSSSLRDEHVSTSPTCYYLDCPFVSLFFFFSLSSAKNIHILHFNRCTVRDQITCSATLHNGVQGRQIHGSVLFEVC